MTNKCSLEGQNSIDTYHISILNVEVNGTGSLQCLWALPREVSNLSCPFDGLNCFTCKVILLYDDI